MHEGFCNDTYRLSDEATAVLRALQASGPSDVHALASASGAAPTRVTELLQELQGLGLVGPC